MTLFRRANLAALIIMLSTAVFALIMSNISAPEGQVLEVESGGDLFVVLNGEPSSFDYGFFILFDLPSDRRKWLDTGETIRVIDVPSGETHAKVEVLSGPHKGSFGWVDRDLITPRWHKTAARHAVDVLIVFFFGVLLMAAVKVIKWVIDDPNAIYARPSIEE